MSGTGYVAGVMTTTQPPLSAAQREQQRLDYIEKVDKLAFLTRETCKALDGVMADVAQAREEKRLELASLRLRLTACERTLACLTAPPWWMRLLSRFGR